MRQLCIIGILVLLVGAGCGAGDASPGSTAESPMPTGTGSSAGPGSGGIEQACAELEELRTSVDMLESLDPEAPRDELRQAANRVASAWANVTSSLSNVLVEHQERLESRHADLEAAIDALPEDISIRDALAELEPQATAFAEAVREAVDDLGCE